MFNVKNKVCLITGAASGIGFGIAEKFAEHGAKIIIADKNLIAAQEATEKLQQKGIESLAIGMDVTDEQEVTAGFKKAADHFQTIDILISNAGIQIISPIVDFPLSDWKKLIDVHVHGGFLTAQAAMQQMMEQKTGGAIIFIGSIHASLASLNKSAYVTAKHALLGLTRAIAKEGAPHKIHANMVSPGFVKTPLVEKQIPEQAKALNISEEEVVKKIMLGNTVDGEFTTVEEVANTALFFASFPSAALTGQSLLVTHGWHME